MSWSTDLLQCCTACLTYDKETSTAQTGSAARCSYAADDGRDAEEDEFEPDRGYATDILIYDHEYLGSKQKNKAQQCILLQSRSKQIKTNGMLLPLYEGITQFM